MVMPFEVTYEDIEGLSADGLTQLTSRLLFLEAEKLGLPKREVDVALNITAPDGGQDGHLEWSEGPDPSGSNWIATRNSLFQVKATKMEPRDCKKEVIQKIAKTAKKKVRKKSAKKKSAKKKAQASRSAKKTTELKPRVKEVVEAGGAYVLIYGLRCEGKMASSRKEKFREAFAEHLSLRQARSIPILVYGAEKLAEWTNEHAAAVSFVLTERGRNSPAFLQPWEIWKEDWESNHQSPIDFYPGTREEICKKLRESLRSHRSVVRLVGLSGLGKSRLALEIFSPDVEAQSKALTRAFSSSCVYVRDGSSREREVEDAVALMVNQKMSGCIVVDECPVDLHRRLENLVISTRSRLSLLTLDFDPESDPRSNTCNFYRLERLSQEETQELILQSRPEHEEIASRIAIIAQGFPRIVELILEAIQTEDVRLWDLPADQALERLVVRRSTNPDRVLKVARALAVFEHVGVNGVVSDQLNVIADVMCEGKQKAWAYKGVRELEKSGIAYRRGNYVRITPLPIAVMLAAQWWDSCHEEEATRILLGDSVPTQMVEAATQQIRRLSGHKVIEELMQRVLGDNSPFVQQDQVLSAPGSYLLSSLAEICRTRVCSVLWNALSPLDLNALQALTDCRRGIVNTLEKLAWWPDTFQDSAWMLLRLAGAENESWGNNATNQIKQLFQIYLSGTEVPAVDRLSVLDLAISGGEVELVRIAIECLSTGLESAHFTRMGGVDVQGGSLPRKDWAPSNTSEIGKYWSHALARLLPFLKTDSELGVLSRKLIADRARGVIKRGGLNMLRPVIEEVLAVPLEWAEMQRAIRSTLNYDKAALPPKAVLELEEILRSLEPNDIEGRLRSIVSEPGWSEIREEDDGSHTDVAEERARGLGRELAAAPEVTKLLPMLLSGEQQQGFAFGESLGLSADSPIDLVRCGLNALRSVATDSRNVNVLMGLCRAASNNDRTSLMTILHPLLDDEELNVVSVDLMRASGVDTADVVLLTEAIADGRLPVHPLIGLSYGRALETIDDDATANLIKAAMDSGEKGIGVATALLGMRIHKLVLPEGLKAIAQELTLRLTEAIQIEKWDTMFGHHFMTIASAAIQDDEVPGEFLRQFARILFNLFSRGHRSDHVRKVAIRFFETHVDIAWREFRATYASLEVPERFKIQLSLSGLSGDRFPWVDLVGVERLVAWCEEEPIARRAIARMCKPLQEQDEDSSWTPLARILLEKFGDDKEMLDQIAATMYSGCWSGSAVPRLQKDKRAFEELKTHRHSSVVAWATTELGNLRERIEYELKRDEERDFGIL